MGEAAKFDGGLAGLGGSRAVLGAHLRSTCERSLRQPRWLQRIYECDQLILLIGAKVYVVVDHKRRLARVPQDCIIAG